MKYKSLALVLQRVDITVHWINRYPLDNCIGFDNAYLADSGLSAG